MKRSTPKKSRSQRIVQLKGGDQVPKSEPRRYLQKSGYVNLRWTIAPYSQVEIREHRVVDGVVVPSNVHVHHRNGKKHDNRPENLEFVSPSDHAKLHHQPSFDTDEATRFYAEGWSLPRLAERYGIHCVTVMRSLKRRGVVMRSMSEAWNYRKNKTFLDAKEVTTLLRKGYRVGFIASVFGVSRWPVEAIRLSAGIPPFPPGAPRKAPHADAPVR